MKNHKSIISFLTASALVLSLYSFSHFLVEDVSEVDISMEYYYPTATQANFTSATTAPIETTKSTSSFATTSPPKTSETTTIPVTTTTAETTETTTVPATTTTVTTTTPEPTTTTVKTTTKPPATTTITTTTPTPTTTTFKSEIITAPDEAEEEIGSLMDDDDTFQNTAFTTFEVIIEDPSFTTNSNFITSEKPDEYWDFGADSSETTTSAPSNAVSPAALTFTVKYDGSVKTEDAFELVCKIVNNEISSSYSLEAIKAQAVAAYSFLKFNADNGDVVSVLTKANPPQTIVNAVASVWGKCCYYNGKAAQTNYHASSAGSTTSAESVWGADYPYLVSVPCPFDVEDVYFGCSTTISAFSMKTSLESALGITLSDSPENWLTIQSFCDGKYVSELNIDGQKVISGRKLRENVLGYGIKSAAFDVYYADGNFYFTTYGYGHGVGMSQHGANILAKNGFSYEDILKHYFTGIQVM